MFKLPYLLNRSNFLTRLEPKIVDLNPTVWKSGNTRFTWYPTLRPNITHQCNFSSMPFFSLALALTISPSILSLTMKSNLSSGWSVLEWMRVSSRTRNIVLFGDNNRGRCNGLSLSNTSDLQIVFPSWKIFLRIL